eukprot:jgi/Ulvmu1/353/UM001_0358.1
MAMTDTACGIMQTLVMHCEQWVTKFSLLLHEIASEELTSIYDFFTKNMAALRATPESLDDLATVVNLQRSLDAGQAAMAARFEPLQNMFRILEKVRYKLNLNQSMHFKCPVSTIHSYRKES